MYVSMFFLVKKGKRRRERENIIVIMGEMGGKISVEKGGKKLENKTFSFVALCKPIVLPRSPPRWPFFT